MDAEPQLALQHLEPDALRRTQPGRAAFASSRSVLVRRRMKSRSSGMLLMRRSASQLSPRGSLTDQSYAALSAATGHPRPGSWPRCATSRARCSCAVELDVPGHQDRFRQFLLVVVPPPALRRSSSPPTTPRSSPTISSSSSSSSSSPPPRHPSAAFGVRPLQRRTRASLEIRGLRL